MTRGSPLPPRTTTRNPAAGGRPSAAVTRARSSLLGDTASFSAQLVTSSRGSASSGRPRHRRRTSPERGNSGQATASIRTRPDSAPPKVPTTTGFCEPAKRRDQATRSATPSASSNAPERATPTEAARRRFARSTATCRAVASSAEAAPSSATMTPVGAAVYGVAFGKDQDDLEKPSFLRRGADTFERRPRRACPPPRGDEHRDVRHLRRLSVPSTASQPWHTLPGSFGGPATNV